MTSKPHIVFLDEGTIGCDDLDLSPLKKLGVYQSYFHTKPSEVQKRIQQAHIVISNKVQLTKEVMLNSKCLKMVAVPATGYNNVDVVAAKRQGVAVANVPGYATTSVAEHALMMMLGFSHRLFEYHAVSVCGEWVKSKRMCYTHFQYQELSGKTLGIVGLGSIGKKLQSLVKPFGMKVMSAQIPGRPKQKNKLPLATVLKESDYVSLHCPLTPLTQNLINEQRLNQMQPHAVLINLARGAVVDELAVAKALKTNRLRGYGADAFSIEPLPKSHALLHKSLRNQIIFTPHMAWASLEARMLLCDELCANIKSFLDGKARNRVV